MFRPFSPDWLSVRRYLWPFPSPLQPVESEGGLPHPSAGLRRGCRWNSGRRVVVPLLRGLLLVPGTAEYYHRWRRTVRREVDGNIVGLGSCGMGESSRHPQSRLCHPRVFRSPSKLVGVRFVRLHALRPVAVRHAYFPLFDAQGGELFWRPRRSCGSGGWSVRDNLFHLRERTTKNIQDFGQKKGRLMPDVPPASVKLDLPIDARKIRRIGTVHPSNLF